MPDLVTSDGLVEHIARTVLWPHLAPGAEWMPESVGAIRARLVARQVLKARDEYLAGHGAEGDRDA